MPSPRGTGSGTRPGCCATRDELPGAARRGRLAGAAAVQPRRDNGCRGVLRVLVGLSIAFVDRPVAFAHASDLLPQPTGSCRLRRSARSRCRSPARPCSSRPSRHGAAGGRAAVAGPSSSAPSPLSSPSLKDELKEAFGRTWPETWVQHNPSLHPQWRLRLLALPWRRGLVVLPLRPYCRDRRGRRRALVARCRSGAGFGRCWSSLTGVRADHR